VCCKFNALCERFCKLSENAKASYLVSDEYSGSLVRIRMILAGTRIRFLNESRRYARNKDVSDKEVLPTMPLFGAILSLILKKAFVISVIRILTYQYLSHRLASAGVQPA